MLGVSKAGVRPEGLKPSNKGEPKCQGFPQGCGIFETP
jgi:hypothetical protein